MHYISLLLVFSACIQTGLSVWCYDCISTQPGCGSKLNWLWHWTTICPENNDVCVKIIEIKHAEEIITRTCLSTVQGFRTDIPADHYEGCRPAALDVKLANYVNNSVKELDIHRNYYDSTTWCFCFMDNWCNQATATLPSVLILLFSCIITATHF